MQYLLRILKDIKGLWFYNKCWGVSCKHKNGSKYSNGAGFKESHPNT